MELRSRGRPLPPGLTPLRLKFLSVVYALVPGRWAAEDVFSATAARMSAFNAFSSILSPSWKSMARLVLPSRLELKRPEGSSSEAPLAKVIFTIFLYVSPVQMMPACDHTGTPLHFHSSTTSGSACLMSIRTRASVSPRQSLSSLILPSISCEGASPPSRSDESLFVFFMVVVAFFMVHRKMSSRGTPRQCFSYHSRCSATV